jgi:hypothetical protein
MWQSNYSSHQPESPNKGRGRDRSTTIPFNQIPSKTEHVPQFNLPEVLLSSNNTTKETKLILMDFWGMLFKS